MIINYREFFGFKQEPFSQDLKPEDILVTSQVEAACVRIAFAVQLRCVSLVTGDIGSGKSTSLRYAVSKMHPSKHLVIPVVATNGTFMEILRQIGSFLGFESLSSSVVLLRQRIQTQLLDIHSKRQIPVLIIDEASLLRTDVFMQLHTLAHFEFDSKPVLPIILAGQESIMATLNYPNAKAFASRVMGISQLKALDLEGMKSYLNHHLNIAGVRKEIFGIDAVTAVQQKSGGKLRTANNIARGALVAATLKQCQSVTADHVRLGSSEVICDHL